MNRLLLFMEIVSFAFVLHSVSSFSIIRPSCKSSLRDTTSPFDTSIHRRTSTTRLYMDPNLQSDDPFVVLGIDPDPSLDKKQIKRAYKRMALQYHPDMTTTLQSTDEEKKIANDNFVKINWAYQQLSGKNKNTKDSTTSSSSTSSSSGYTKPPHRRKTDAYTSSGASTDWRDYMPNYEEDEKYDTDGDSFGQIFSDLVGGVVAGGVGVAAGGKGGGGVFRDFVDFLENNVNGYSSSKNEDDAELEVLLRSGTLDEVANEMDDTDLVVQQLSTKADKIRTEIMDLQADRKLSTKYMEKIEIDEKLAELEARQGVVAKYVKQARKRLTSLQTKYKELIVSGDSTSSGRRSSTSSSNNNYGSSSSAGSYSDSSSSSSETSSSYTSRRPSSSSSSSNDTTNDNKDDDAWKYEGFGSSGRRGSSSSGRRRRGSSSRRRSSSTTDSSSSSNSSSSSSSQSSSTSSRTSSSNNRRDDDKFNQESRSRRRPSEERQKSNDTTSTTPRPPPGYEDRRKSITTSTSYADSQLPPHRRTRSNSSFNDNKRRLNEIKVDDEFEKLKKDLGL